MWGEKKFRAWKPTDDNMAHAHFMLIPKATNTHSRYVIIIAIPLHQWLYERASMLRYTYVGCFFFLSNVFSCSKLRPNPLGTAGFSMPDRNLKDFAFFKVGLKRYNCP